MTAEPEPLRAVVGERIRVLRRARGMSAQELADALGWPLDTLVNYEYGRRPIPLDRLSAVAETLALPPAALLIADTVTADLVVRLVADPSLVHEVAFFLDALQAETERPAQPPEHGR